MRVTMFAICAAAVSVAGYQAEATSRSSSTGTAVVKMGNGELHLRSERRGGVRVIASSLGGQERLLAGDLVLQMENRAVGTPEDIFQILRALDPGAAARAQVLREGRHVTVRLDASLFQGFLPPVPPRPPSPGI